MNVGVEKRESVTDREESMEWPVKASSLENFVRCVDESESPRQSTKQDRGNDVWS